MELNHTTRLEVLLNDIQDIGLAHIAEAPRQVHNYTVADFLLLNGVRQPPVRMGATVMDTFGNAYLVKEYKVVHTEKGIVETIEVMRAEYEDRPVHTTRTMTVDEFYKTFGKSVEELI